MESYTSFFAQTSQPYFGMSMASAPSYGDTTDKAGAAASMDTSFFTNADYSNFRFSPSLGVVAAQPDLAAAIGTIDGSIAGAADGIDFAAQDGTPHALNMERRSSSEEKDNLTPAQSRRKAQNRAAQRAFRERKEKHVKDLETKLAALESSASALASDNQRLKLALQRATTENEILRSTSRPDSVLGATHRALSADKGAAEAAYASPEPASSPESEGVLLPASATWDFIQAHPLVRQGYVDIADVCERLRGAARCDGSGPVFSEKEVRRLVEESRRGGGHELI